MNVFIDTNIYRKIFEGHPSTEYFEKLLILLQKKELRLIFPKITRVEVYRNIAEILKKEVEIPKFILPKPSDIFADSLVIKKLEELGDSYKKEWELEHKKLISYNLKLKKEMSKKLFSSFLDLTIDYQMSKELYELANERKMKVFPPGKNQDPLGDQLVWEIILKYCTNEDLIIVSADGDWQDLINKEEVRVNPFLVEEWKSKTNKKLSLLKDLGELIIMFEKEFKIPENEIKKEKQATYYISPPLISVSPSLSSIGTPSIGTTFTVVQSLPSPSIMSGSPGFLPKSNQCVDCGKDKDNSSFYCNECLARRGLI